MSVWRQYSRCYDLMEIIGDSVICVPHSEAWLLVSQNIWKWSDFMEITGDYVCHTLKCVFVPSLPVFLIYSLIKTQRISHLPHLFIIPWQLVIIIMSCDRQIYWKILSINLLAKNFILPLGLFNDQYQSRSFIFYLNYVS